MTDIPTETAIARVQKEMPRGRQNRAAAVEYIEALNRGNLICLDCGSENHTRGHELCNFRWIQ